MIYLVYTINYKDREILVMILIKNIEIYAPEYLGMKDLLICGNKIECIGDKIELPEKQLSIEVIDGTNKVLFPGFIDSHVHILGGGGEGGFKTRTPEINVKDIVEGGVTTVVGCIGTDGVTRDMKGLIAKSRALEEEGISSYVYTGSYKIPSKPLMSSIEEDIILIDKIIGVGEVALSDHRGSQPSLEKFIELASEARRGGILSGKAGIINIHLGDGKDKLKYIREAVENTEIPIAQFLPTHINRNEELFNEGIEYAKLGGRVDLTTSTTPKFLEEGEVKCSKGLKRLLDSGVDIKNITFSSDAQGSLPIFNDLGEYIGTGVGKVSSLYNEVCDAILEENIPIETAIKVITSNAADILKLQRKGRIRKGNHGDLVVVNKVDLKINSAIAKGEILL